MRAPVPAALPAGPTRSSGASGTRPEHQRMERIDLAAERTRQLHAVHGLDAEVVHQQPGARVQGSLRQLDRADVVLGDRRGAGS